MVTIATGLFIAKFNTGCQKNINLFIPLLVLSSLHTKKNTHFL